MMPLDNLKVLDFTHLGPGQFCTMILSDMGADVVRVEQPSKLTLQLEDDAGVIWRKRLDAAYDSFNRNKRSIALNLRTTEAREAVYRLAENTDVVVVGFRPGVPERLGIDYETLRKINPKIVYCAMTGYGQEGPYRDLPGHDINYMAVGGALHLFGNPPRVIPNIVADYAGGALHAVIGILLAIVARERCGRGQLVDVAYTDTVVALLGRFASTYLAAGKEAGDEQLSRLLLNPGYGVYRTKDQEYISVAALEPRFWQALCRALGKEELAGRYGEIDGRGDIQRSFAEIFSTKTRQEWFELLTGYDIPVGEVHDLAGALADPHLLSRQMVVETEDPLRGRERHVGIPIKMSGTPGRIRSGAPAPGQHTRMILSELGYSEKEIDSFLDMGVAQLPPAAHTDSCATGMGH